MDKKISSFVFLILSILCMTISSSNASPLMGKKVKPAEQNEFPFIVSLGLFAPCKKRERYLNHFCGGSLITQKHILTAAHCVVKKKPFEVIVTVGNVDLNEGKIYTVKSWVTYDEWMMSNNNVPEFSKNDIAVATLTKNVMDIVPAVRSNLPDTDIFGKKAVTAGWGLLLDGTRPQVLQKATLRILTPKECKRNVLELFGTEDALPRNHYCTAAKPPVILGCGDSGGPLLLKDTKKIVGVNEGACEVENAPTHRFATSVHVKVNYFKEFIDDASKE